MEELKKIFMKFNNTIACNDVPRVIHMNTVVLASNTSKKSICDVGWRIPAGEFLFQERKHALHTGINVFGLQYSLFTCFLILFVTSSQC